MPRVCDVQSRPDYHIHVRFDDGREGEVDVSELVGCGVFAAWRDPAFFAQVNVDPDTGAVAWPGGIDLCPDRLYRDITGAPLPGDGGPAGTAVRAAEDRSA